jgi:hypothetical protein
MKGLATAHDASVQMIDTKIDDSSAIYQASEVGQLLRAIMGLARIRGVATGGAVAQGAAVEKRTQHGCHGGETIQY